MYLYNTYSGIGFVLGLFGILLTVGSYIVPVFSVSGSLFRYLCFLCGLVLLHRFWRHVLFSIPLYKEIKRRSNIDHEDEKNENMNMDMNIKKNTNFYQWLDKLFHVQVHDHRLLKHSGPVIFIVNHVAKFAPYDQWIIFAVLQHTYPHLRLHLQLSGLNKTKPKDSSINRRLCGSSPVYKHLLQQGTSLVVCPEYDRLQLHWSHMIGFENKKIFQVAQELQVPIVPIVLDGRFCQQGWIDHTCHDLNLYCLEPTMPSPEGKTDTSPEGKPEGKAKTNIAETIRQQMNRKLHYIYFGHDDYCHQDQQQQQTNDQEKNQMNQNLQKHKNIWETKTIASQTKKNVKNFIQWNWGLDLFRLIFGHDDDGDGTDGIQDEQR